MKKNKDIGKFLITSSFLLFVFDQFGGNIISNFLGKLLCNSFCLQKIDSLFTNYPCGTNSNMYFTILLFILLVIGISLLFSSNIEKDDDDKNKILNKY
ncbi:hypothetical protein KAI92_03990 [Candidatus Parcubacteria bacterium]|nr:hypothetical protein [Candidatus Parcubacteria bacterium]